MLREGSHYLASEASGFLLSIVGLKNLLLFKCPLEDWDWSNPDATRALNLLLPTASYRQNFWCLKCGLKWLNVASGWWENYSFLLGWSRCGKKLLEAFKTKLNSKKAVSLLPLGNPLKTHSDSAILLKILFLPCLDRLWLFSTTSFISSFWAGFISLSSWSLMLMPYWC